MNSNPNTFVIHEETRLQYAGLFILKEMMENDGTLMHEDEEVLNPILSCLQEASYIKRSQDTYTLTQQGMKRIHSFLHRYSTFADTYDVFSGVDVEKKDFAIRYYNHFTDQHEWESFLRNHRWQDLRIAIAEYQGFDAIEITFMRFVHDDRFGRHNDMWHYERLLGRVWDEIQAACNNAVRLHNLKGREEGFLGELLETGQRLMEELSEPCF
jgi:hypothetical protein